MKKHPFTALLSTLALTLSSAVCLAQGSTSIIYQGHLNESGQPANGLYDFRCQLYDRESPGGDVLVSITVTNLAVPITNGVFVLNLDFGADVFNGQDRWLSIDVRGANDLNYTHLAPRQRFAPAPYAVYATKAGDFQAGANPTFTGTPTFNPASGPPFNVNSQVKVSNLNADLFDGLDSTAFVLRAGGTMTGSLTIANPGSLSFGSSVRQMVNLWGTSYGIGVQAAALYLRSDDGFAWFRDGVHSDLNNDPGAGGQRLMTLSSSGALSVFGSATRGVYGEASAAGGIGVFGFAGPAGGASGGNGDTGVYGESDQNNGNGLVGVANNGGAAFGVWGKSTSGYAGHFDGAVRINFASPFNKPQLEVKEPSDSGFARLRMQTGTRPLWDIALGTSPNATNMLRFYSDGNGDVMTLTPQGNLSVRVLTITGGADLAEPFPMSDGEIPKGALVIIDEKNPGQLKMSNQAYDTRVAGIVSGANGIKPGVTLRQEGALESGENVALSGRVYALADAGFGAIKPGDLLTTSATPGHAMRVKDRTKAQGAVIGKAMTGLNEGKGTILVLVSLQ